MRTNLSAASRTAPNPNSGFRRPQRRHHHSQEQHAAQPGDGGDYVYEYDDLVHPRCTLTSRLVLIAIAAIDARLQSLYPFQKPLPLFVRPASFLFRPAPLFVQQPLGQLRPLSLSSEHDVVPDTSSPTGDSPVGKHLVQQVKVDEPCPTGQAALGCFRTVRAYMARW